MMNSTNPFIVLLFLAIIFLATSTAGPLPESEITYFPLNASDPTVQEDGRFAISEYNKKADATSHLEFIRVVNATGFDVFTSHLSYTNNYHLVVTRLKLEAKNCSQPDQYSARLYFAELIEDHVFRSGLYLNYFATADDSNV